MSDRRPRQGGLEMGVRRDPERDAHERYFRASATAILLESVLCGALAIAVLLDCLDAASTTAVVAVLGAGFGLCFGFLLFRLYQMDIGLRARGLVELEARVDDSAEIVPSPAIDVSVSRSARRLSARSGGRAYVWLSAAGDDHGRRKASMRDPGNEPFTRVRSRRRRSLRRPDAASGGNLVA